VPAESTDGEGRGAVSMSTEGAALLRRRGHLKICFEAEGVRLGRRRASAKRWGRGGWGGGGMRRAWIGMQGKTRVGGERPDDEKKDVPKERAVRGGNYDNISSFLAVG
jgi:hypothetical protein